jgi:hypothetical protein
MNYQQNYRMPVAPERNSSVSSRSDSVDMTMAKLQALFPTNGRYQRMHPSIMHRGHAGPCRESDSSNYEMPNLSNVRKGSDASISSEFGNACLRRGSDESTSSLSSCSSTSSSASAYRMRELLFNSCYSAPRRLNKYDKLDSTGKLQDLADCLIMLNLEETRDV